MDLSVIIVNYNVRHLLVNCIESILAATGGYSIEIIVVDNNSFDDSVEFIKKRFNNPAVRIVENKVNYGFAKANNIGAREARGKYLLILNPDTIVREDTIEKSLRFYESQEKIGAATCKLVLPNGNLDLACRRSFPSPSVAIYRILGLSKLFPSSKIFARYNLTYLDEDETHEVEAICGAFMLIRKDIYELVGGFDEDYFMYGEDLDICYRIRKAGFRIYYYSGTSVIHFKGESTRKSSVSYVNYFYGAMKIFVRKNLKKNSIILNSIIRLLISYRALISYLVRILRFSYPALIDVFLIVIALLVSIWMRFEFFPLKAYELPILIYSIVWIITLTVSGAYKRENILSLLPPLFGILIGFFINSSLTYFFNEYAFSRVVILRTTAYSYVFLAGWRGILKMINFARQKNIFSAVGNTVIIGKNDDSELFLNKLRKRIETDYNILGYVSTGDSSGKDYIANLGNLNDVIASNKVKNVIFAKSVLSNQQILDLMWNLRNFNLNYRILSTDSDMILGKSPLDKIDEIYLMQIEYNINKKINIFVKRAFDLVLGMLCLVFVFPFVQLYLRFSGSEKRNQKFLKKVLLIPEVIKGKLSFVGRATWDTTSTGKRFLGKNGLTGLVQINFYKNLSEDECEYYNYYYAKNQTIVLDLEIILKTISLFLFSKKVVKL